MLEKNRERKMNLTIIWLTISIAGSIFSFIFNNNLYTLLMGITFAIYGIYNLFYLIKLIRTEVIEPEDVAIAIAKKLGKVPILDTPCLVSIERQSQMKGAMEICEIHLFGIEIGTLKNGETFKFTTVYVTNELKIYYPNGAEIEETFQADAGGTVRFLLRYFQGKLEKL